MKQPFNRTLFDRTLNQLLAAQPPFQLSELKPKTKLRRQSVSDADVAAVAKQEAHESRVKTIQSTGVHHGPASLAQLLPNLNLDMHPE